MKKPERIKQEKTLPRLLRFCTPYKGSIVAALVFAVLYVGLNLTAPILVGYAIDNAIEAVVQVKDPEQRLILLSVSRQKGFLSIRIKNRYEAGPYIDGILPETTKPDKRYHGYGLKSIRSTVEKYGGTISITGEDGWFGLDILIPLKVNYPDLRLKP